MRAAASSNINSACPAARSRPSAIPVTKPLEASAAGSGRPASSFSCIRDTAPAISGWLDNAAAYSMAAFSGTPHRQNMASAATNLPAAILRASAVFSNIFHPLFCSIRYNNVPANAMPAKASPEKPESHLPAAIAPRANGEKDKPSAANWSAKTGSAKPLATIKIAVESAAMTAG